MRVLVNPCYSFLLENRLFSGAHSFSDSWMQPYAALRKEAVRQGVQIDTIDLGNVREADVVLFQDLPPRPDFARIRAEAPQAKFLLQLIESPLSRPQNWDVRNHRQFDAVLTYNRHLQSPGFYFHYNLPIGKPPDISLTPGFYERRPVGLINSNRNIGWAAFRRRGSGLAGMPFVGPLFQGWHVSLGRLLSQNSGELYSKRREIVRAAGRKFPSDFDVWGQGWSGEPVGWTSRLRQPNIYTNAKGPFKGDKTGLASRYRVLVAFENIENDCGYISEKIFDAMFAGAVPVYRGNWRITDHVPPDCFIDARRFNSPENLLEACVNIGESEWLDYRRAIDGFLASDGIKPFLPEAFCRDMLSAIRCLQGSRWGMPFSGAVLK
jgi:hypothetical protein